MTFIDILGFRKMVEEKPLTELKELIEKFMAFDDSENYVQITKIKTKYISDSLIVWMELNDPKDITSYFVYLGSLIGRIHRHGDMYVRGCVAYGNHYNDDCIWISPVFIEAYLGEKKAKMPRVILLESTVTAINQANDGFLNSIWFEKDSDGIVYINYMNLISGCYYPENDSIVALINHSKLVPALKSHKKSIEKCLSIYPEQKVKYQWLAKEHNDYIEKHVHIQNKDQYKVV